MIETDFFILYFIQNDIKNPFLDIIMPFLSHIGEGGAVWILTCLVMLFFKRTRTMAVAGLIAMAITLISGELVMKNIFCRIRPCYIDTSVQMLIPRPGSYSFPSGHTSSSFACAAAFFVYNKRIGVPALIFAGLIGFSRLYNFVHFPSDVAVGALLGIVSAVLVVKGVQYAKSKYRKPA